MKMKMIHQAVIPAAGRSLRLDRPGTPKPLVDLGGQPLVVRLIRQLYRACIERIVVVVGYDGDKIKKALLKYDFAAEPAFVDNPEWELGISRSVPAAEDAIDGPFILAMADHVFDDRVIDMAVAYEIDDGRYAAVVDDRLSDIFALDTAVKVKVENEMIPDMGPHLDDYEAVDTGLFVFTPSFFDDLRAAVQPGQENQLAAALVPAIADKRLRAVKALGRVFDDVDTPAALVHCEMRLRAERREARVSSRANIEIGSAENVARFDYCIDAPKTTTMLVGRGFVTDPSRLELIPAGASTSPIFVFTDETVHGLYGRDFQKKLTALGYDVHGIVLPVVEESKSITNYALLVERVLMKGVDERSVFISLGKGVVCNVCGFVASTIYRGLDLVHLPTTLMSQCDSGGE